LEGWKPKHHKNSTNSYNHFLLKFLTHLSQTKLQTEGTIHVSAKSHLSDIFY